MNKINIHPLEGMTIEKISRELNGIATGKYTIYVDLNDGQVNIGKSSRNKKNELVIGKVDYLDNSKKKFAKEFFTNVRRVIKNYHDSGILICKSTAIKQFSKKFVDNFEPVLYVDNPYYKRSEPMCLYDVNALKYNVNKYRNLIPSEEEKVRRHNAAKKAYQSKLNKCLNYASNVEINVPNIEKDDLERAAYDYWYEWEGRKKNANKNDLSKNELKKLCIDYLRFNCMPYDDELDNMYDEQSETYKYKVDIDKANDILQDRINNAIYEKYQWLR